MEAIGEGSFGTVFKAKSSYGKSNVAIKVLMAPFKTSYTARQTYREIKLMRKLTEQQNNEFTPQLYDLILPREVFASINAQTLSDPLKEVDKDLNLLKMFTYVQNTEGGDAGGDDKYDIKINLDNL